jgi:hypothetical protein
MSETRTIHFTLGENAGALLATIAQEHLEYNHNPRKAVETITESLIGVPTGLAMKILHGDLVLLVENDEQTGHQQFVATEFVEGIHDKIGFTRLDCSQFVQRKTKEIYKTGLDLTAAVKNMGSKVRSGRSISIDYSYEQVLDFLNGNEKTILDELRYDSRVSELELLIRASKAYIQQSVEEMAIVDFMKRTWPQDFEAEDYSDHAADARLWMTSVMEEIKDLMNLDFAKALKEQEDLDRYITAANEIDEVIKKGIEPVDIMAGYDAGWLAPNGDYYALNGEIANMLHNQIADALYAKGLIEESDENKTNPDGWLQAKGWVRIHGNEINFEGHMNERVHRGPNVYMTDIQIDKITEYCRVHHGQAVKCFFQPVSALTFQMMAKDVPQVFYKKYFDW